MRKPFIAYAILVLLTCLAGVRGQGQVPAPAQNQQAETELLPLESLSLPKERLGNLGVLKQLVKKYYACTCDCGCYEKEAEEQGARAIELLRKRAATATPGEKLAVVLDIDDTALSMYPFYATHDLGHIPGEFDNWVATAKAPAIHATLAIFSTARKLGIAVFFITGRREDQREVTEQNLRAAGYTGWSGITFRTPAVVHQRAAEYKSSVRQQIVGQGYRLVLNVGDQLSDLVGNPTAEFSVKLPNPMYVIP